MTAKWVSEELYEGWRQQFRIRKELVHTKSPFQDIMVCESEEFGRVLFLDGVVQITEKDEFVYQEMLSHVPLIAHGKAENVLIVGAGDGGVLRRVLQHSTVKKADMVEIDGEVIEISKKYLPTIAGQAWSDPRANVIVGDGVAHVKQAGNGVYDVIIVDSTDPIGVGEVLFTDEFYENCARILSEYGLIVNQCGVPFLQADELRETSQRRKKFFPYVSAYCAAVPTYIGGFMTLGVASKNPAGLEVSLQTLKERANQAGLEGKTRYWTPALHRAAFVLPPYIAEQLP
ncbi:polyamine aminopropyltransferase [Entomobacter blattae]|nr:polyamine aminopropyltransferase [Entomobacter blattae]